jgi:hypothetical protein
VELNLELVRSMRIGLLNHILCFPDHSSSEGQRRRRRHGLGAAEGVVGADRHSQHTWLSPDAGIDTHTLFR